MVHKSDWTTCIFKQSSRQLYYLNIGKESVALVNMVEDKKFKYTVNSYKRAAIIRELQRTIGRPSTQDFITISEADLLKKFPVTKQDILIAQDIFGPEI